MFMINLPESHCTFGTRWMQTDLTIQAIHRAIIELLPWHEIGLQQQAPRPYKLSCEERGAHQYMQRSNICRILLTEERYSTA